MPSCSSCGATNRGGARFCYQCAAPLTSPRPSADDHDWLAATLTAVSASPSAVQGDTQPLVKRAAEDAHEDEGGPMNQPPQPEPDQSAVIGGRYAIVTRDGDEVEVLDQQPWKRCWACGAT